MKMYRNKSFIVLLVLIVCFITSCKKETHHSIPNFSVSVTTGYTKAHLSWDLISSDSSIRYSIYLNSNFIQDVKGKQYVLSNLKDSTSYSGSVVAHNKENNIKEVDFHFTTMAYPPLTDFQITTNLIASDSVSVSWTIPKSPLGGSVLFNVSGNGQLIVQEGDKPIINLGKLSPQTPYQIEVTAYDTLNKSVTHKTVIETLSVKGAQLFHKNIVCQNLKREFWYYRPSNTNNSKLPLFVFLHGAGGIAGTDIQNLSLKNIAEKNKFIVAMPQALLGTSPNGTYIQWNAHEILAWDDVLFINHMIDTLCKAVKIDTTRMYLSGMSNGGFMTFYTVTRCNRFAAIAPMSGLISYNIYNKYKANWPLPLLYIHGTADSIVQYNGGDFYPSVENIIRFWVNKNNCDTTPKVTQLPDINRHDGSTVALYDYLGTNPKSEIRFYKINGGIHAIAGNQPTANQDINAFEVAWDFFKNFSK